MTKSNLTLFTTLVAIVVIFIISVAITLVDATFSSGQPQEAVIGVLSQPNIHSWNGECGEYCQTTYTDWISAHGVRSVPVHYWKSEAEVKKQLSHLQGVIFTGGMLDFEKQNQFYKTAKTVYDYAMQNDKFHILAICQGFQLASVIAAESNFSVLECDFKGTMGESVPLVLEADYKTSKFFSMLPDSAPSLLDDFTKKNTTANLHNCGVQPVRFEQNPNTLGKNLRILSTNVDHNNKKFVSTWEHKTRNVLALQWHPSLQTEWYGIEGLNKDPASLRVASYVGHYVQAFKSFSSVFSSSISKCKSTWWNE